ncbi:MAG: hypothetical protein R3E97_22575 [Candidatus Eisenbacteria bacterium]
MNTTVDPSAAGLDAAGHDAPVVSGALDSGRALAPGTSLDTSLPLLTTYDNAGGDDVYVFQNGSADLLDLQVASNGDLYLLGSFWPIRVYRSTDGGESWSVWGTIDSNGANPSLHLAEGVPARCFVAYQDTGGIYVTHAVLGNDHATFSPPALVMPNDGTNSFGYPDITSDAISYDNYFVYLVGGANRNNEGDIWFARSTNQGDSFEPHYAIATMTTSDRSYVDPQVAYGFGGYVHVAWSLEIYAGDRDEVVRYRRASLWGNGGLSAWGSIRALTASNDGVLDNRPWIAASPDDEQVVVATFQEEASGPHYTTILGSTNSGSTFVPTALPEEPVSVAHGVYRADDGTWLMGTRQSGLPGIRRSNGSDFASWSQNEILCDAWPDSGWIDHTVGAVNRSTGEGATAWIHGHDYGEHVLFDAEWRGGPGYPNVEDGFPVALNAPPVSPPAVVDLDGDGDLEILWSDQNRYLWARHHDGSLVAGWPVEVGLTLSDGPLAIGDLGEDGSIHVLVGTADGRVLAYRTNGNLESGWPFQTGQGAPAYVSIGRFGGPRVAAVAAGDQLFFVDFRGQQAYGFSWIWAGRQFTQPVSIGDVNGDGVQEAVGAIENLAFAVPANVPVAHFWRTLPADVSSQLSLGDLDLDGDAEVIVPLANGALYALQEDGSDFPGSWPFVTPSGSRLSSAAIGTASAVPRPRSPSRPTFAKSTFSMRTGVNSPASRSTPRDGTSSAIRSSATSKTTTPRTSSSVRVANGAGPGATSAT